MKQSYFSTDSRYHQYVYKGLHGRYAHWPASSRDAKRTFVLIYGQHATLERIEPIAQALSDYGDVYAVDTPGFGGMESSYKIKQYPSLDFMAGHLSHFVNKYVQTKRLITFMGISFGLQIITSALDKDHLLAKRTEEAISFAGFVSYKDFSMPISYQIFFMYLLANLGRTYIGSKIIKVFTTAPMLRFIYFAARPFNVQHKSLPKHKSQDYLDQQIWLWQNNDARTHAATGWDFLRKTDMTSLRLPVSMVHVGVPRDHLLKNAQVSAELRIMYKSVIILDLNLNSHTSLDLDSSDKIRQLLPATLKELLMKSNNKSAEVK